MAFLVSFSYGVLNRTVDKWFTRPAEGIKFSLIETSVALGEEVQNRAQALANWIALMPGVEVRRIRDFSKLCIENRIAELRIESSAGVRTVCDTKEDPEPSVHRARAAWPMARRWWFACIPCSTLKIKRRRLKATFSEYYQLASNKKNIRSSTCCSSC